MPTPQQRQPPPAATGKWTASISGEVSPVAGGGARNNVNQMPPAEPGTAGRRKHTPSLVSRVHSAPRDQIEPVRLQLLNVLTAEDQNHTNNSSVDKNTLENGAKHSAGACGQEASELGAAGYDFPTDNLGNACESLFGAIPRASLASYSDREDREESFVNNLGDLPHPRKILDRLSKVKAYKNQVGEMIEKLKSHGTSSIHEPMINKMTAAWIGFADQEQQYLKILDNILQLRFLSGEEDQGTTTEQQHSANNGDVHTMLQLLNGSSQSAAASNSSGIGHFLPDVSRDAFLRQNHIALAESEGNVSLERKRPSKKRSAPPPPVSLVSTANKVTPVDGMQGHCHIMSNEDAEPLSDELELLKLEQMRLNQATVEQRKHMEQLREQRDMLQQMLLQQQQLKEIRQRELQLQGVLCPQTEILPADFSDDGSPILSEETVAQRLNNRAQLISKEVELRNLTNRFAAVNQSSQQPDASAAVAEPFANNSSSNNESGKLAMQKKLMDKEQELAELKSQFQLLKQLREEATARLGISSREGSHPRHSNSSRSSSRSSSTVHQGCGGGGIGGFVGGLPTSTTLILPDVSSPAAPAATRYRSNIRGMKQETENHSISNPSASVSAIGGCDNNNSIEYGKGGGEVSAIMIPRTATVMEDKLRQLRDKKQRMDQLLSELNELQNDDQSLFSLAPPQNILRQQNGDTDSEGAAFLSEAEAALSPSGDYAAFEGDEEMRRKREEQMREIDAAKQKLVHIQELIARVQQQQHQPMSSLSSVEPSFDNYSEPMMNGALSVSSVVFADENGFRVVRRDLTGMLPQRHSSEVQVNGGVSSENPVPESDQDLNVDLNLSSNEEVWREIRNQRAQNESIASNSSKLCNHASVSSTISAGEPVNNGAANNNVRNLRDLGGVGGVSSETGSFRTNLNISVAATCGDFQLADTDSDENEVAENEAEEESQDEEETETGFTASGHASHNGNSDMVRQHRIRMRNESGIEVEFEPHQRQQEQLDENDDPSLLFISNPWLPGFRRNNELNNVDHPRRAASTQAVASASKLSREQHQQQMRPIQRYRHTNNFEGRQSNASLDNESNNRQYVSDTEQSLHRPPVFAAPVPPSQSGNNTSQRRSSNANAMQQQPQNRPASRVSSQNLEQQYCQLQGHMESIRSIFEKLLQQENQASCSSKSVGAPQSNQPQQVVLPQQPAAIAMPSACGPTNASAASLPWDMSAWNASTLAAQQSQLTLSLLNCQQQLQMQQQEMRMLRQLCQDLVNNSNSNAVQSSDYRVPSTPSVPPLPVQLPSNLDGRPLSSASLYNLLAPNPYLTYPYYPPVSSVTPLVDALSTTSTVRPPVTPTPQDMRQQGFNVSEFGSLLNNTSTNAESPSSFVAVNMPLVNNRRNELREKSFFSSLASQNNNFCSGKSVIANNINNVQLPEDLRHVAADTAKANSSAAASYSMRSSNRDRSDSDASISLPTGSHTAASSSDFENTNNNRSGFFSFGGGLNNNNISSVGLDPNSPAIFRRNICDGLASFLNAASPGATPKRSAEVETNLAATKSSNLTKKQQTKNAVAVAPFPRAFSNTNANATAAPPTAMSTDQSLMRNFSTSATASLDGQQQLDDLHDTIYSEVAAFISLNEQRPQFLLQMFRELKQLQSDFLRSRALDMLRQLSLRYSREDTETDDAAESSWPQPTSSIYDRPEKRRATDETTTADESMLTSEEDNNGTHANYNFDQPVVAAASRSGYNTEALNLHQTAFAPSNQTQSTSSSNHALSSAMAEPFTVPASHQKPSSTPEYNATSFTQQTASSVVGDHQQGEIPGAAVSSEKTKSSTAIVVENNITATNNNNITTSSSQSVDVNVSDLEQEIQAIVDELLPVIREKAAQSCNSSLLAFIRKLVLTLAIDRCTSLFNNNSSLTSSQGSCSSSDASLMDGGFLRRQLSSILDDTLMKFKGQKLSACGDELLADVSEVVFNELAFFRLMQNIGPKHHKLSGSSRHTSLMTSASIDADESSQSEADRYHDAVTAPPNVGASINFRTSLSDNEAVVDHIEENTEADADASSQEPSSSVSFAESGAVGGSSREESLEPKASAAGFYDVSETSEEASARTSVSVSRVATTVVASASAAIEKPRHEEASAVKVELTTDDSEAEDSLAPRRSSAFSSDLATERKLSKDGHEVAVLLSSPLMVQITAATDDDISQSSISASMHTAASTNQLFQPATGSDSRETTPPDDDLPNDNDSEFGVQKSPSSQAALSSAEAKPQDAESDMTFTSNSTDVVAASKNFYDSMSEDSAEPESEQFLSMTLTVNANAVNGINDIDYDEDESAATLHCSNPLPEDEMEFVNEAPPTVSQNIIVAPLACGPTQTASSEK